MLLLIDNYDSFTYNLAQYFYELGQEVIVYRHDEISLGGIVDIAPNFLVIGPGPYTPQKAGISIPCIQHFAGKIPILGVCLGHQSIAEVFGGKTIAAKQLMHGKRAAIRHDHKGVFTDIPSPVQCTRYNSLVSDKVFLPACLEISAWSDDGDIMGLRHRTLAIEGIQLHPESFLSEYGYEILNNFINQ